MAQSDELDELLPRAAARVDALRAAGLRGQLGVAEAQKAALEREQGRLSQKLGPDDPRVKALALRLEDGQARLRDLRVEVARAETVPPATSKEQWALHGHVLRPDLSPAADLTVSLADAQGQWLRPLGFACTDARGYFRLLARPDRPTGGPVPTGPAVFVRLTDSDRKELYRGKEAVTISPGAVEYREIILEPDGVRCAAPGDENLPTCAPAPAPAPPRAEPGGGRSRKAKRQG